MNSSVSKTYDGKLKKNTGTRDLFEDGVIRYWQITWTKLMINSRKIDEK